MNGFILYARHSSKNEHINAETIITIQNNNSKRLHSGRSVVYIKFFWYLSEQIRQQLEGRSIRSDKANQINKTTYFRKESSDFNHTSHISRRKSQREGVKQLLKISVVLNR